MTRSAAASAAVLAMTAAGCGEFVRESRSPSQLVITSLEAASGAEPDDMGATLRSDVATVIERPDDDGGDYTSFYNDIGQVTMRVQLRDPGTPGTTTAPSTINSVTINRYRVTYRRSDGRNTPGVDVPFPIDSAITVTVGEDNVEAGFDIVRHSQKNEAPLTRLTTGETFISTVADVTFYGRDQAGNEVAATGSIGITFGNFADPE
jgi:hypothetical protein